MKKYIFFTLLLFSTTVAFAQQTMGDSVLVRKYGHLHFENTKEKLSDSAVCRLLTSDDFALYQKARKQYKASIPLWTLYGSLHFSAIALLIAGIIEDALYVPDPDREIFYSGVFFYGLLGCLPLTIGAFCFLIPAITLTAISCKKLNRVSLNYNQRNNPVSLKFGFNSLGVGLTLNF